jgi:transcriptional regulator with XRE-family HTH domain
MPPSAQNRARSATSDAVVLSRAALRAASFLGVSQAELAAIIGLSEASISRIASGQKALEPGSKSWQLAALFVRLFRSLDAIVGSDDVVARAWMRAPNTALGGVPLELASDVSGLVRSVDYLDAARARL